MPHRVLWLILALFSFTGTALAEDAAGQWTGKVRCSYGSGSLKLNIDASGNVTGSGTNVTIRSGSVNGRNVAFQGSNFFGNQVSFNGSFYNGSMSGTYTQTANRETCQWSVTLITAPSNKAKISDWDDRPDKEHSKLSGEKRRKALIADAGTYMTAGKAAAQYCSYADQIKAEGRFLQAAEMYGLAGAKSQQRQAQKLAALAGTNADKCDKKRKVAKKPANKKQKDSAEPPSCQAARDYADALEKQGETKLALEIKLKVRLDKRCKR